MFRHNYIFICQIKGKKGVENLFEEIRYGRKKEYEPNLRSKGGRLSYGGVLILPRTKMVEKTDARHGQMMNRAFGKDTQTTSIELKHIRAADRAKESERIRAEAQARKEQAKWILRKIAKVF